MDAKNPKPDSGRPCCEGTRGGAANCNCDSTRGTRRWVKTLISVVVILAALGVGLVSLVAGRSGGPAAGSPANSACCPAAPDSAKACQPTSCCPK